MALSSIATLYSLTTFFPKEIESAAKSESKEGEGIFPELSQIDLQIFRSASVAMSGIAMLSLSLAMQCEFLAIPIVVAGSGTSLLVGIALLSLTFLETTYGGENNAEEERTESDAFLKSLFSHKRRHAFDDDPEPNAGDLSIPGEYGLSVTIYSYEKHVQDAHWIHSALRITSAIFIGASLPLAMLPPLGSLYEIASILPWTWEIALGSAALLSAGVVLFAISFFTLYQEVLIPVQKSSFEAASNPGAYIGYSLSNNESSVLPKNEGEDALVYLRPEDFWKHREILRLLSQRTQDLK